MSKIRSYIKTKCGIEKYNKLKDKKGFLPRIRLYWFILLASLRDYLKK
ncbi:MAG: hypothetical protein ACKN84_04100 [Candidatus Fonsibacter sp.]|jgi:hypothetical protein